MYQTVSADNLPSTASIRKSSNFKSSNEEQNSPENGRITTSTGAANNCIPSNNSTFEGNGMMQQQDQHHHQHLSNSSLSHESSPSRSQCLGGGSGDVLLQWGQRKRSRCSRTESRSVSAAGVSDKHQTINHVMPPPHPYPHPSVPSTSTSNGSRGGGTSRVRPNGLLYGKDSPAFLPTKNRNLVEQMGSDSASPLRNGGSGSRPISRSTIGKRSPSCIEKNEKKISSPGSLRKIKSDDSLVPVGNGHHVDSAEGELEYGGHAATTARSLVAEAEKGCEVVECPRIYISLSRKEKEDDFYAMKGSKLPHRPKKRAKAVDRALQYCFPGLWLSDLTRARYEVRERKSTKKPKRRGLKGLENMDSDSE